MPQFETIPNFVCLTICFKNPLAPYLYGELNGALNGELNGALKTLSLSIQSVYNIIKQNPGMQRKDIVVLTKHGSSTIDRYLALLVEKGLIEHLGSKKTGGYYAKSF
jgi:ATP-dependent DNA helicase RecG